MREYLLTTQKTHDRWNRDLHPVIEIESGAIVHMEMHDSSGGQVQPDWTSSQFETLVREKIHTLTGPIFVKDAKPGDILQIDVLDMQHFGWGWTSLIPGLGLIPDRFPKPYLFIWELEELVTRSLEPAVIPLNPFCGIMGVCPDLPGEHRTRPPGSFGGNLDIRQLGVGASLFLPVQVPGALFSAGDAHAAQGDGEVCINGIEMPSRGTFRFTLHSGRRLSEPMAHAPVSSLGSHSRTWIFISSSTVAHDAAQSVVHQTIDFLIDRFQLTPELAYILCSVALDLKISQWVNQPMVTITGHLSQSLFPTAED